mmetsp:Transcript_19138/g.40070  ORF Transcript_19138/g.40070 Transcript_19138/m.40070 type:complete len:212 (-) Transcript_19138:93-728(-)
MLIKVQCSFPVAVAAAPDPDPPPDPPGTVGQLLVLGNMSCGRRVQMHFSCLSLMRVTVRTRSWAPAPPPLPPWPLFLPPFSRPSRRIFSLSNQGSLSLRKNKMSPARSSLKKYDFSFCPFVLVVSSASRNTASFTRKRSLLGLFTVPCADTSASSSAVATAANAPRLRLRPPTPSVGEGVAPEAAPDPWWTEGERSPPIIVGVVGVGGSEE